MTCIVKETAVNGKKFRSTTRNFKGCSSLVLLLVAVHALAGCGRQDRYEVLNPGPGQPALPETWAELVFEPMPSLTGRGSPTVAGWSADDYLLELGGGQIYRVQGDRYLLQDWPGSEDVTGMVVTGEDEAWGVDVTGLVCRLQN